MVLACLSLCTWIGGYLLASNKKPMTAKEGRGNAIKIKMITPSIIKLPRHCNELPIKSIMVVFYSYLEDLAWLKKSLIGISLSLI